VPTDGGSFVSQLDVVFVSVEFRQGALGFLAHRAFDAENASSSSGNYGALDVMAVLQRPRWRAEPRPLHFARYVVWTGAAGAAPTRSTSSSPRSALAAKSATASGRGGAAAGALDPEEALEPSACAT